MTEKKLNTLFKKFDDFQYLLESVFIVKVLNLGTAGKL